MKERSHEQIKRNIYAALMGAGILIGSLICVLIIAALKDIPQNYDQFVIENMAFLGTNKTNELTVFYLLLFLSLATFLIFGFLHGGNVSEKDGNPIPDQDRFLVLLTGISSMILVFLGGFSLAFPLLCLFLLFCVCCFKKKDVLMTCILWIFIFVSMVGIYECINLFGRLTVPNVFLLAAAAFFSFVWLFLSEKKQYLIFIRAQLLLPLSVLNYAICDYQYQGKQYHLSQPLLYRLVVYAFVLITGALIFIQHHKCEQRFKDCEDRPGDCQMYICGTSCVCIAAFAAFPGAEMIVSDMHHPGEMMISFTQIFQKGLLPYADYFPVSGLFSAAVGAINALLGNQYSYAAMTASLFCITIALVTVLLLKCFFDKKVIVLISFFLLLSQPPYIARTQLILPLVLLVFLPYKSCIRQIMAYILCCLLMGLYYPLYGVAFALGIMPYELYQLCRLKKDALREKEMLRQKDKLNAALLILLILFLAPMLFGMAKHILVYSSQSLLADGYTVIGNLVPDRFFPYLSRFYGLRLLLYYGLWFGIPILFTGTFIYLTGYLCRRCKKAVFEKKEFYFSVFAWLFCCIGFTYSQMRIEEDGLLGRTVYVIFPVLPILLLYIFIKNKRLYLPEAAVLGLMLAIGIQYDSSCLSNLDTRSFSFYEVADSYVYCSDSADDFLGECFVLPEIEQDIKRAVGLKQYFASQNTDPCYTGMYFSQLYGADLKTIGQPSIVAMKSKAATLENLEQILDRDVVIAEKTTPYGQYLWNRFLMTSDDIFYLEKEDVFVTRSMAQKMGKASDDKSKHYFNMENIGALAHTLGRSYAAYGAAWLTEGTAQIMGAETYEDSYAADDEMIYEQGCTLYFDRPIRGAENDFIFLSFSDDGTGVSSSDPKTLKNYLSLLYKNTDINVMISWTTPTGETEDVRAYLIDGCLLFPLGMNSSWYSSEHDSLTISVLSKKQNPESAVLQSVAFFQLQE